MIEIQQEQQPKTGRTKQHDKREKRKCKVCTKEWQQKDAVNVTSLWWWCGRSVLKT